MTRLQPDFGSIVSPPTIATLFYCDITNVVSMTPHDPNSSRLAFLNFFAFFINFDTLIDIYDVRPDADQHEDEKLPSDKKV